MVRYPIPNSTFPIAQAVQVPGNATTYYVSGQVPPVVNKDADPASPQAYGDTKTQTVGVLNRIKAILEGLGLGMADVVKMQVFLVHDARAPMDFKAFMEGYTQFFGGSQPNLPARSVVGVAALANPGFLVEIEVDRRQGYQISTQTGMAEPRKLLVRRPCQRAGYLSEFASMRRHAWESEMFGKIRFQDLLSRTFFGSLSSPPWSRSARCCPRRSPPKR